MKALIAKATMMAAIILLDPVSMSPTGGQEQFNLISIFDSDQNGQVSEQEFLGYLAQIEQITSISENDEWKESGKIAFRLYDKDTDGELNSQ